LIGADFMPACCYTQWAAWKLRSKPGHTSSRNSTKREVVESLAALVGLEVCETITGQRVCRVFSDKFIKSHIEPMFATEHVKQNATKSKDL